VDAQDSKDTILTFTATIASNAELREVFRPKKPAHVVLRTKIFEASAPTASSETTKPPRIGIINFKGLGMPSRPSPGLEHIAFTFDKLDDLTAAYE
jgi:hypothetical protein